MRLIEPMNFPHILIEVNAYIPTNKFMHSQEFIDTNTYKTQLLILGKNINKLYKMDWGNRYILTKINELL